MNERSPEGRYRQARGRLARRIPLHLRELKRKRGPRTFDTLCEDAQPRQLFPKQTFLCNHVFGWNTLCALEWTLFLRFSDYICFYIKRLETSNILFFITYENRSFVPHKSIELDQLSVFIYKKVKEYFQRSRPSPVPVTAGFWGGGGGQIGVLLQFN